jgi:hypothetical protein
MGKHLDGSPSYSSEIAQPVSGVTALIRGKPTPMEGIQSATTGNQAAIVRHTLGGGVFHEVFFG